jgi:uncharacterized repeat protein (TIGR02543 family)
MGKISLKMSAAIIAVMMLATTLSAAVYTITLNQNFTGAPGNMVVQTDDYGCLTGAMNAPLVLPSPTRDGYDFRGWFTEPAATGGTRVLSGANGTNFTANTTIYARWTTKTTRNKNQIPALEKEHFDWVKNTRNVCESVMKNSGGSAGNLTFHQIFAGNGSISWAVRWESNDTISLQERRRIAGMLYDGINEWLRPLMGYEDWPFGEIPVTVVGWAVQDAALIRDRQPNETIWVNSIHEGPVSGKITGYITSASRARSRFLNYSTINNTSGGAHLYRWADSIGGLNGRFDKYLWLTKDKEGGNGSAEGGDWGFRWGQQGPGNNGSGTAAANSHATRGLIHGTMVHEIGHSFGMYDWYGQPTEACASAGRNPPGYGNSSRTMMHYTYESFVSGDQLNQYDQWQIRYYYDWTKEISPAGRWNYTPVPWVEVPSSNNPVFASKVQLFNLNNRGIFSYNLGEANSASLKIFDSHGKLLKTISLNGTHGIVDTQLGSSKRVLFWRVENNGRLISQSKGVIW